MQLATRGARMNANTEFFEKLSKSSVPVDETKCAFCHRDLKSPSERIRGHDYIICESCYRSLLHLERNDHSHGNI
jgi:hypothetical protein